VDVNVRQAMTGLTLEIIGRTLFDVDLTADSGEISRAVAILSEVAFHEMQAAIRLPNWWPTEFYRRKRWAMRTLDGVVWRIVRARRAEGTDRGDLLSMLLASVDEEGDGGKLSDRQVRDEAMTLMLAGHDTSAAALEWMCYLLAKHPEVAARCREEIGRVIGERDATAADVGRLSYLQAVIQETLRLYPPAIGVFLRQAVKELQIGGYAIAPGSLLALSSYVTHRDARWFPDPERFEPERFLAPQMGGIPNGAYFPFGAGPRVCIGQSFAMTEMTLIAATLLRRLDVRLLPGFIEPQPHVHVSLRPDRPLTLRWSLRR
jgi:cytochrome P450